MSGGRTHIRPPGEVLVHIYRPPARFGLALALAVRDHSGEVWLGNPTETGSIEWERAESGIEKSPFMYIDDEIASAMYRALGEEPVRTRSDLTLDHLRDTMAVRDRLMNWVETLMRYSNDSS